MKTSRDFIFQEKPALRYYTPNELDSECLNMDDIENVIKDYDISLSWRDEMPFGKYKGTLMSYMDANYLLDLYETRDISVISFPLKFGRLYRDVNSFSEIPPWYVQDIYTLKKHPEVIGFIKENYMELLEQSDMLEGFSEI